MMKWILPPGTEIANGLMESEIRFWDRLRILHWLYDETYTDHTGTTGLCHGACLVLFHEREMAIAIHLIKAGVSRLDWSKTKTIFIVVFSILNIFLYSLYLNQYHDGENVQVAGRTSIEDLMKQDNITYNLPQVAKNDFSHIYADVKSFSMDELEPLEDQSIAIVDNTTIESEMTLPVSIRNEKEVIHFTDFLTKYVWHGVEYELWEFDEERREGRFLSKSGWRTNLL